MAEKPLIPGEPERFMTTYVPQAAPPLNEDGEVMEANEALEAQRKAFENAEKGKDKENSDQAVEAAVHQKVTDMTRKAVAQNKPLHEVVDAEKKDEDARKKLADQVRSEMKADAKKAEAVAPKAEAVKKADAKLNEAAEAKAAAEGNKRNVEGLK